MTTITKPRIVVATLDATAPDTTDSVARAAARLYDAETALHAARQSHVDGWISAAYDRLHEAVEAHRLAMAGHAA
jgi:thioredoxin-like negative regulator of GroEL